MIKIEMQFLPDVYVPCDVCKGKRYSKETLQIKYKGKNIADILELTVEEALSFFRNIPQIKRKLKTLYDVGLGYIRLGQPATTLSGGEAQRVKLSKELSKIGTGKTLYILDEPTSGLHFADIEKLLDVLNRLVDKGNTVLVIEHNPFLFLATLDCLFTLGFREACRLLKNIEYFLANLRGRKRTLREMKSNLNQRLIKDCPAFVGTVVYLEKSKRG